MLRWDEISQVPASTTQTLNRLGHAAATKIIPAILKCTVLTNNQHYCYLGVVEHPKGFSVERKPATDIWMGYRFKGDVTVIHHATGYRSLLTTGTPNLLRICNGSIENTFAPPICDYRIKNAWRGALESSGLVGLSGSGR